MSDVTGRNEDPARPDAAGQPGPSPPADAAAGPGAAPAPPADGEGAARPPEGSPEGNGAASDAMPALQERITELEDRWRRALADADNIRKRHAREVEQLRGQERALVAREWLPVLDSLDRALEHAGADPGAVIEGVRAVRDQALDVLARLGYPRRDDLGQPFDPARHDAIGTRPAPDAPPGTVVEVARPAYGDGDHQLRPALVVVAQDG